MCQFISLHLGSTGRFCTLVLSMAFGLHMLNVVELCSGFASGREGLKQGFKLFWKATPGYHQIEEQIAEGDKVVTRLTSFGKHEGDLSGAPRTGNDLKMTSITIHRIANGKLVEKWSEKDVLGFLTQIGVLPLSGQPGTPE
ncbi:MAG: putative ester cyclase [Planctomycetaceae bacterium]|nr:putative ester cyclase [Planctomycetaceae bacterium]